MYGFKNSQSGLDHLLEAFQDSLRPQNRSGQLGRANMDFSATCNRFVVVYPRNGKDTVASKSVRCIASGAYVCAMILQDDSLWL